jgi:[CysO sulfur-carrier protein]-S-L-cysteine hydrolase
MTEPLQDHPGPASAELSAAIRAEIVEHARAEYPNEACGVIVGDAAPADGGRARRFVAMRNAASSPSRYRIDDDQLLHLTIETDDAGDAFWAIVHSHTHSPAVPSPTDIRQAVIYRDPLYILVSLAEDQADPETGEPGIRGWRIVDGAIHEVALTR